MVLGCEPPSCARGPQDESPIASTAINSAVPICLVDFVILQVIRMDFPAVRSVAGLALAERSGSLPVGPDDHDLCGLDQRRSRLAHFQFQVEAGIARNDGGDNLAPDIERNFCQQTDGLERDNPAHQLVPSADEFLQASS